MCVLGHSEEVKLLRTQLCMRMSKCIGFGSNSWTHFPDMTFFWHYFALTFIFLIFIFLTILFPVIYFPDIHFPNINVVFRIFILLKSFLFMGEYFNSAHIRVFFTIFKVPFISCLALFRNEITPILTPSTSAGGEWGRWRWSRFSFWRSLIMNPQC